MHCELLPVNLGGGSAPAERSRTLGSVHTAHTCGREQVQFVILAKSIRATIEKNCKEEHTHAPLDTHTHT